MIDPTVIHRISTAAFLKALSPLPVPNYRHWWPSPIVKSRIVGTLLLRPGQRISTEELLDSVYGDDPEGGPEFAARALHVHVSRLRRAYGWPIKTYWGQ